MEYQDVGTSDAHDNNSTEYASAHRRIRVAILVSSEGSLHNLRLSVYQGLVRPYASASHTMQSPQAWPHATVNRHALLSSATPTTTRSVDKQQQSKLMPLTVPSNVSCSVLYYIHTLWSMFFIWVKLLLRLYMSSTLILYFTIFEFVYLYLSSSIYQQKMLIQERCNTQNN